MEEEKSPWHVLSQKTVYDNNWIEVIEYDVINPSGGKGIYGKVHFKGIAIGVIALDDEWNTYLVGQYRFPLDEYSWEIPEGAGHYTVDPLDSAKRELQEETGLIAGKWSHILTMHLSNSVTDEFSMVFLAQDLEQQEASPDETEKLVIQKIPFDELYARVSEGKITDSMTVAAALKIRLMILEGKLKRLH